MMDKVELIIDSLNASILVSLVVLHFWFKSVLRVTVHPATSMAIFLAFRASTMATSASRMA